MAAAGEDLSADSTPKVLLCGPHGSGKTSILQVVFEKKSPHETLFLEPTAKKECLQVYRNALMRFDVVDFPGTHSFETEQDSSMLFSQTGVIVFVIDAQEEPYADAIAHANKIIQLSHKVNPNISYDILIHKIDGDQFFSEEHKVEIRQEIDSKLGARDRIDAQINFHCTSIYDHTIFEAFSRIVQKLLGPQLPVLEQCLDCLITNSRMERAYLFDAVSKIYIASDPHPVDLQSYELCSDMIDVVIDVSCIYGMPSDGMSGSDSKSSCVIHLNNGNLLYLREVDCCLALVCILREENFDRQHLLDYNIKVFKDALQDIFQISDKPARSIAYSS